MLIVISKILLCVGVGQTISHAFVKELGNCVFAASLDVIYEHAGTPVVSPVKVKLHGAFLYQGYLLLVKVRKNKSYSPRHSLPLSTIRMTDIPDKDGELPLPRVLFRSAPA